MSQEKPSSKITSNSESYQLKDIHAKNTDETTPLTKHDGTAENNATENNVNKESSGLEEKLELEKDAEAAAQANKRKTITIRINPEQLLQNRNIRIIVAIGCFILLLLAILVIVTLLCVYGNNDDKTYRFIRIVPKPRGPTNLIYYRHGDLKKPSTNGARSWKDMVKEIDEFLAPYRRPVNASLCMVNNRDKIPEGNVCLFDLITIAQECLKPDYGYMSGSPCIFIVFNNITDWMPPNSNQTDTTNIVDLECTTNTQFDAENIGPMEFTPFQGFSSIYFPYKNEENYMAPFVALRLPSPTHNVGIGLTCRFITTSSSNSILPNQIRNPEDLDSYTQEPVPYIPFNIYIE